MGLGGISPWSLVLVLVIVLLLFGTKKLRNLGSDLGGALKGFKKAMNDDNESKDADATDAKKVEAQESEEEQLQTASVDKKESAETK